MLHPELPWLQHYLRLLLAKQCLSCDSDVDAMRGSEGGIE